MKRSARRVTDHAVIRYLEQVRGLDMDEVRREIAQIVDVAAEHPDASSVTSNGYRYALAETAVMTVTKLGSRSHRRGGPRRERDQ